MLWSSWKCCFWVQLFIVAPGAPGGAGMFNISDQNHFDYFPSQKRYYLIISLFIHCIHTFSIHVCGNDKVSTTFALNCTIVEKRDPRAQQGHLSKAHQQQYHIKVEVQLIPLFKIMEYLSIFGIPPHSFSLRK